MVTFRGAYAVKQELETWSVDEAETSTAYHRVCWEAGIPTPEPRNEWGSIIGVVATDAPLLPHQCDRLAQRIGLGVARVGGTAAHTSGDLFFAFATGNRGLDAPKGEVAVRMLSDGEITPLYAAVIDATEEAILNAMLAAETMTGRDGHTVYALDADVLREALRRA